MLNGGVILESPDDRRRVRGREVRGHGMRRLLLDGVLSHRVPPTSADVNVRWICRDRQSVSTFNDARSSRTALWYILYLSINVRASQSR